MNVMDWRNYLTAKLQTRISLVYQSKVCLYLIQEILLPRKEMEEKFDRWWMWWIRETIYRREELYISLDYRPTFLLFWNFGLQLWSNLTMVNIKIPDMLSVSMSVLLLYYLTFFWGGWLCNVVLNWISFPHWTNRKKVNIKRGDEPTLISDTHISLLRMQL